MSREHWDRVALLIYAILSILISCVLCIVLCNSVVNTIITAGKSDLH